jgi:hypothetical protein
MHLEYQINGESYHVSDPVAVPRVGEHVFVTDVWYVVEKVEWHVEVQFIPEGTMPGIASHIAVVTLQEEPQ